MVGIDARKGTVVPHSRSPVAKFHIDHGGHSSYRITPLFPPAPAKVHHQSRSPRTKGSNKLINGSFPAYCFVFAPISLEQTISRLLKDTIRSSLLTTNTSSYKYQLFIRKNMSHPLATPSFRDLIGVPRSTAAPTDSALLIIDAQNEYAKGQLKVANVDTTRRAISDLVSKWRDAGQGENIIHITHQVPDGAPVFTPNTELAEEFAELAPKSGEQTVQKQNPGSFTGTNLQDVLEKSGKKKVVLTGYMAHVCVSTTARQAAERGYDVLLAKEAIGDRDIPGARAEQVVEMSLHELGDAFGTVVSCSDIK